MSIKKLVVTTGWSGSRAKGGKTSDPDCYRIEKVTNSVDYNPGDYMSRQEVTDLCAMSSWDVTVLPFPSK